MNNNCVDMAQAIVTSGSVLPEKQPYLAVHSTLLQVQPYSSHRPHALGAMLKDSDRPRTLISYYLRVNFHHSLYLIQQLVHSYYLYAW